MINSLFDDNRVNLVIWECVGFRISREILRKMVLVDVRTWGLILVVS